MVFSTPVFLFCFLTLTLIMYYLVPRKFRNVVLFVMSMVFYFWGERIYAIIMIISTIVDFTHGMIVTKCKEHGKMRGAKLAVASSMIINLGILFFFKYWDFIAESLQSVGVTFIPKLDIHLPIGISFYTFQTMSYTIDVYRGDTRAQRNILNFGTYVTLFPQLIAGPIIKYKDLGDQIDERSCTADRFASGVITFVIGLSKKLIIANNVGQLWETVKLAEVSELTVAGAWLGAIAYTLQIYFDFSGYSDMAVGLGRMFGFEFIENFNYPYISKSITEFWRRWHISLSTWFKEYLYIPLGGNRGSKLKWFRNILIVWAATGLWHGASWNFLMWGLYFAVLLILEKQFLLKLLKKLPSFVQHIYTMFFVIIGWVIFGIEDFAKMRDYLGALFGIGTKGAIDTITVYRASNYMFMLPIAVIASIPLSRKLFEKLPERAANVVRPVLVIMGLLICTAYLVAGTYNPFLYFRF